MLFETIAALLAATTFSFSDSADLGSLEYVELGSAIINYKNEELDNYYFDYDDNIHTYQCDWAFSTKKVGALPSTPLGFISFNFSINDNTNIVSWIIDGEWYEKLNFQITPYVSINMGGNTTLYYGDTYNCYNFNDTIPQNNTYNYNYSIPDTSGVNEVGFGFYLNLIPITDLHIDDIYDDGYSAGEKDGYSKGYNTGYQDGADRGYTSGYANGSNDGYVQGYADGLEATDYSMTQLFGSIADTPILMFRSLFNFDLFGMPLLSVILSLFTIILVIHIVKKVIK